MLLYLFVLKQKLEVLCCSATLQTTRVFCAQGAHHNWYRHDRMDQHTASLTLHKELDPNECKILIRNFNGTQSAELKHCSPNASFIFFDRLNFQLQIAKKQFPFTVTKLITVLGGVFAYQYNNNFVSNTGPKN